jgi:DNA-binding transcriptional LysR family regulator
MPQSRFSKAWRCLEMRRALRLLTRTTRSVTTTDAGKRLLQTLAPAVAYLDARLASLGELRDKSGRAKINNVSRILAEYFFRCGEFFIETRSVTFFCNGHAYPIRVMSLWH